MRIVTCMDMIGDIIAASKASCTHTNISLALTCEAALDACAGISVRAETTLAMDIHALLTNETMVAFEGPLISV